MKLGRIDSLYGQDVIRAKKVYVHNGFDWSDSFRHDIAIIELSRSIVFPKTPKTLVRPVCLPSKAYENRIIVDESYEQLI